jgi:hypothetical protein
MSSSSSSRVVSKDQLGSHWGKGLQSGTSVSEQPALPFAKRAQLEADQTAMRQLFASMVSAVKNNDWLATALGRGDDYAKKIGSAINNEKDRKVHFEWIAAMLDEPKAAELIVGWFNERCGYAPPVLKRVVSKQERDEAVAEVVAEMGDVVREAVERATAKKLGVRVEEVKL